MKLCFDVQASYCLKHIWNSHIGSTKITWVLLHKKCTNLVYAKVSDVSKTEKVDSEEMTTKVKRFSTSNREQSQLQIVFQRIEIHFWLSKSKSKSTFQITTKIILSSFWLLRRWYCELWICKEKFKFWLIAVAKLFYNALHSGTHRVDPNFESSNFKRTWHEVISGLKVILSTPT